MAHYVDGSLIIGCSGGGIILVSTECDKLEYATKFGFMDSNNKAEYEVLLRGMELAVKLEVFHLIAYSDSQLVFQYVGRTLEAKYERTKKYVKEVQNLISQIGTIELHQIPRS